MKKISLYFKEGSSDKEYYVQLEPSGDKFVVNFQFGRVGNALQHGAKTKAPVDLNEAEKIYAQVLKERYAKGYSSGETKDDFSGAIKPENKIVHILPQLLNPIEDLGLIGSYIDDDEYLAQEKMDGERRMIIASKGKIIGLNKKGQEVPLPNSILNSIKTEGIYDGEIIGNKFHVFDILELTDKTQKDKACIDRVKTLNKLIFGDNIKIVGSALTKEDKRKLYNELNFGKKEGIVFKKKNSPYSHGRPSSGGNQLKFKFYKTATFIVEGLTKGKRSVGLELMDGNKKCFLGKVTIPPNHEIPNPGDFVEVRYLYAYKGGAIFQPIYLGKREDSDLSDATVAQLVYKSE